VIFDINLAVRPIIFRSELAKLMTFAKKLIRNRRERAKENRCQLLYYLLCARLDFVPVQPHFLSYFNEIFLGHSPKPTAWFSAKMVSLAHLVLEILIFKVAFAFN